MPNIREYNATGGFRPDASAAESIASSGRQVGAMTQQAGRIRSEGWSNLVSGAVGGALSATHAAEAFVTHKEAMKFSADLADVTNTLTHAWNDTRANSDLNDPDVAAKFNEKVMQPALEEFTGRYGSREGQERAAAAAGRLTEHFSSIQMADTATMAGEAAVQDLTTMANRNADTLVTDPMNLSLVNEITADAVRSAKANPLLTAEQQAHLDGLGSQLREHNTVAAFHGMAERNPAAAKAELEAGFGKDDLSAQTRITLLTYADAQVKMREQQVKADEVAKRRNEIAAANATSAQLVSTLISADGTVGTPDANFFQGVKKVAGMPNTEAGLVESLFNFGKRLVDERDGKVNIGVNDPDTQENFSRRMLLEPDDTNALTHADVYRARAAGLLDSDGFRFYESAVDKISKDPEKRTALSRLNSLVGSFKPMIANANAMTGLVVPEENVKYGLFQQDVRQRFEAAYKGGTWMNMLDPANPEFIGNVAQTYRTDLKAHMKAVQDQMKGLQQPTTPQRKPGQSAADYLNENK